MLRGPDTQPVTATGVVGHGPAPHRSVRWSEVTPDESNSTQEAGSFDKFPTSVPVARSHKDTPSPMATASRRPRARPPVPTAGKLITPPPSLSSRAKVRQAGLRTNSCKWSLLSTISIATRRSSGLNPTGRPFGKSVRNNSRPVHGSRDAHHAIPIKSDQEIAAAAERDGDSTRSRGRQSCHLLAVFHVP